MMPHSSSPALQSQHHHSTLPIQPPTPTTPHSGPASILYCPETSPTTNATLHSTHFSTHPNPYTRTDPSSVSATPTLTQTTLNSTSIPPTQQPLYQQPISYPDDPNEFWGGTIDMHPPPHILCVLSQNVNTINPADNFLKWQAAAQAFNEYSVGIACLQETNMQWSHPILHQLHQIMNQLPTCKAKMGPCLLLFLLKRTEKRNRKKQKSCGFNFFLKYCSKTNDLLLLRHTPSW